MKWTEEKIDFGVKLANSMPIKDAYKKFNIKYPISEKAFRSKMFRELRYEKYQNGVNEKRRKDAWTKEEMDYLVELMQKDTRKKAIETFQKRYNRTYYAANTKAKELKLKCNQEAYIKHQQNNEGIKRTQFKKGNVPLNHCEVGAIKIRKNGDSKNYYYWIKVSETEDTVKDWKLAQRYFYEQYHNCEIPKGHKVVFADGDNSNFSKENLILVNNQEFGYWFKYLGGSVETAKTGLIIAKIRASMKRLEKEKNDKSK